MHACILTRPEQIHDRLGSFSRAQDIDSFPKDFSSDDPFICAAPRHQRRGKKHEPQQQNVMGDIYSREKIDDRGEQERQKAENQQEAKVNLPAR